MSEDEKKTTENENGDLKGYHYVDETYSSDPSVLERINAKGDRINTFFPDERKEEKNGDQIKVNESGVSINPKSKITLKKDEQGNYVVVFEDGTEEKVTEETAQKLVKNGVSGGEFMSVEGVRKSTVYEKDSNAKSRAAALLLSLVLLIPIPIFIRGCDDKHKSDDLPEPGPDIIKQNDVENLTLNQVLKLIYSDSFSKISDVLEPASVVRTAQDAYEAIDYDVESMGGDLCRYAVIQEQIVDPGSEFIETVEKFKQTYDDMDEKSNVDIYETMMTEGEELLNKHSEWVNIAKQLVDRHAETTVECIDKGIRGDDYRRELIVTNGQSSELAVKSSKIDEVKSHLEYNRYLIEGIKSGKIDYQILKDGSCLVFDGEETIYFNAVTHNKSLNNSVTNNEANNKDGSQSVHK